MMFHGFTGLCSYFLSKHFQKGYYIVPVRVNGSAIESYFSRLKFSAHGQLSAINYSSAQAAVEMAKSVSTKRPHEADYRDVGVDIKPVGLKRKKGL